MNNSRIIFVGLGTRLDSARGCRGDGATARSRLLHVANKDLIYLFGPVVFPDMSTEKPDMNLATETKRILYVLNKTVERAKFAVSPLSFLPTSTFSLLFSYKIYLFAERVGGFDSRRRSSCKRNFKRRTTFFRDANLQKVSENKDLN